MINRTIIVTSANATLARNLAAAVSIGGVGMFESPLSTGAATPTAYVSSGQLDAAFSSLLPLWTPLEGGTLQPPTQAAKDAAIEALIVATGGLATIAQLISLVDTTVVVDCDIESAQVTTAKLGLAPPPSPVV